MDKVEHPPVQLADMIAYNAYKSYRLWVDSAETQRWQIRDLFLPKHDRNMLRLIHIDEDMVKELTDSLQVATAAREPERRP